MLFLLMLRIMATITLIIRTGQHVARAEPDPIGFPLWLVQCGNWGMLVVVLAFIWEPHLRRLLTRDAQRP